jgi:hypothetical protein
MRLDVSISISFWLSADPAPKIAAMCARLSASGCAQEAWEQPCYKGFEDWYASTEDACVDLQAGPDRTERQVPGDIVGLQDGDERRET